MTITILDHRVAVKPLAVDEWDDTRKRAKAANIIIAETEDEKRARASVDVGEVLQVGPTAVTTAKVGDTVAYVRNAGKFISNPFTQEEVYVLNDEDVLAILDKEATNG